LHSSPTITRVIKKKIGMRWNMRPLLVQKLGGKDHLADLDLE